MELWKFAVERDLSTSVIFLTDGPVGLGLNPPYEGGFSKTHQAISLLTDYHTMPTVLLYLQNNLEHYIGS